MRANKKRVKKVHERSEEIREERPDKERQTVRSFPIILFAAHKNVQPLVSVMVSTGLVKTQRNSGRRASHCHD